MAKLIDILQLENDRKEETTWNVIHLFKTGSFYSAYEWSAWLIAVITFNNEVRLQTKDRKPIAVTRIKMANSEDTFCRVGFPIKSVEKYIPSRLDFSSEDDKHIVISVEMPQPTDGSVVTYERLFDAVKKWKESQPIKQQKGKEDADPNEETDQQPSQSKPSHSRPVTDYTSGTGLISQIISYPLSSRTPIENFEFIKSLQHQIARIL